MPPNVAEWIRKINASGEVSWLRRVAVFYLRHAASVATAAASQDYHVVDMYNGKPTPVFCGSRETCIGYAKGCDKLDNPKVVLLSTGDGSAMVCWPDEEFGDELAMGN